MNAFYLDEALIKELEERAVELVLKQPILSGSSVQFRGVVRFADNSSQEFVDLSRMLKRSADEHDPESVVLSWKALISGHGSMISCIEASFVTEKRLKTGSLSAFEFSYAYMQLEVYSADEGWVEEAFAKTRGIFESARLPWLYAPLLMFRNKIVVQLVAQSLGWSGFFVFSNQVGKLLRDNFAHPTSVLSDILANDNIIGKIDLLSRYLINPANDPWWSVIVILGGGIFVFLVLLFILMLLLPMLVPRSIISMGLAKHKLAFWANVAKFLFLTVGISGFVIPVARYVVPTFLDILSQYLAAPPTK
jgi:hypothetical protein